MELIRDSLDLSGYTTSTVAHAVKPASDWHQEVIDNLYNPTTASVGPTLPWDKARQKFNFRPGEVTIWAGINSHGKSQLVGFVCLGLMQQMERLCMASLEMKPMRTMTRMVRQASGKECPPIPFIKSFHQWTDGKLWLYDHLGQAEPDKIVALCRYCALELGITHIVVDNLTKVIADEDDYNGQKRFINAICACAADLNVHIHVVAHVRKGNSEDDVPNKFSIKGAGSITDQADNVFIVWRNKAKEEKLRNGEDEIALRPEPDCILVQDKQRNGETEAKYLLWFHQPSCQYLEYHNSIPKCFTFD